MIWDLPVVDAMKAGAWPFGFGTNAEADEKRSFSSDPVGALLLSDNANGNGTSSTTTNSNPPTGTTKDFDRRAVACCLLPALEAALPLAAAERVRI